MRIAPVIIAGCLAACACAGGHRDTRTGAPLVAHPTTVHAEMFLTIPDEVQSYADAVNRISGGTLAVQLDPLPYHDVAAERHIVADVRSGRATLGIVAARVWDTLGIDDFRALIAPFAITTYAHEQRVLESPVATQMLAGLSRHGLAGVALLPGAMRRMLGIDRPYLRPSDFRAARIAMQDSRVARATMRALGAKPVPAPPQVKPADAEGYEQQLGSIASNGYFKGAHAVTTNLILWPRPIVVFANPRLLGRLSPRQRRALITAGRSVIPQMTRAAAANDRQGAAQLCRAGVPLVSSTPSELRGLAAATQPVDAALAPQAATRRFMRAIRALRSPADRPLVPRCHRPGAVAVGRATPFDGVYHQTVTAAQDAKAEHLPQAVPENYGQFVWVFDRGRYAMTQRNATACTWAYGTAVVRDGLFIMDVIDGGGIAPSGAVNKPGEHFVFRPLLYHGTLTLQTVGAGPPSQVFQRTSERPSLAVLEPHCRPPAIALGR
jgi:TRAP-type C4-dicarboxylate transport system substrate-binding protein